ncbi:hypothetical protein OF377_03095 [Ureaplasma sp. ES3154-GEN]|nr:hypothetical protein [Ureaplasma sp. ES3154-GEN]MCV3743847.1 hypothetical protein [Ureaplasma sp. ES3154-GEN]
MRPGTLDKDSTLLDNIKVLHQEFETKYDNAKNTWSEEEINNLFIL